MIEEWNLPKDLVLLDGDGHTWIALDYSDRKVEPSVVLLESESNTCITLAKNFEDFIALIKPYDEVFDEDDELREP